jgi:hypothetical protein
MFLSGFSGYMILCSTSGFSGSLYILGLHRFLQKKTKVGVWILFPLLILGFSLSGFPGKNLILIRGGDEVKIDFFYDDPWGWISHLLDIVMH